MVEEKKKKKMRENPAFRVETVSEGGFYKLNKIREGGGPIVSDTGQHPKKPRSITPRQAAVLAPSVI